MDVPHSTDPACLFGEHVVSEEAVDFRPPAYSDEALALKFSAQYGTRLRYIAAWARWYEWTGSCWQPDTTLRVLDRARAICREASTMCNDPRVAPAIASAKTVAAVERLAKADRRHAATVEQWDLDPWLLNTPAGVIDLRDGITRSHCPDDHVTKITAVAPGGDCPQWRRFLARITGEDTDLQKFLQRVAGYCLTGSVREHALFFGYGSGGNGKGVFLGAISGIMGSYATVASMESLTASAHDRHPTDLAMLSAARLVTAQETEEGRRWAEARIKAMTGGDPITARFMRRDFFTFQPVFKLVIAGNHKPGLANVDEAIRRRFNLIPFEVQIPASEHDNELSEKLKAEWPGILGWMIAGCLEWQRTGLAAPAVVINATAEYLAGEDAFGLWLGECCVTGRAAYATAAELFASWNAWALRAHEAVGSQRKFSQTMQVRGFRPQRNALGYAGFAGIALVPMRSTDDQFDG